MRLLRERRRLREPAAEWPTTVIPKTSAENRSRPRRLPPPSRRRPQPPAKAPVGHATAAGLDGDEQRTSFRLELSKGVTAEIFTLANPYRVVVDLPDVTFELPSIAGREERGLVKTFRYGLFAEGKARIVIDTTGPVRIERAAMAAAARGKGIVFTFDLLPDRARGLRHGNRRRAPGKSPPEAGHQRGSARQAQEPRQDGRS